MMSVNLPLHGVGGTAVATARQNAMNTEREARIESLRTSLQAGTYQVDAQALAARLLDHPSNPLSVARAQRAAK